MYCIGIPDRELYLTVLTDYSFGCSDVFESISIVIIDKDSSFTIYNSFNEAKDALNEIKTNKEFIQFTDSCFCEEISNVENEFDVEELEICQVTINKMTINPENS